MNRRDTGRARFAAALGGVLALVGCFLPWYTIGGEALTARSSNGFEGAGILVFVAAILVLTLILLPPVVSDPARVSVDRGVSFAFVTAIGVLGFLLTVVQLAQLAGFAALTPSRAVGLWTAAIGLALMVWAALDMLLRRRPLG